MGTIKAITIRQPWVWAIMVAGKRVENRTWGTSYRGPLLIHAATGMTKAEYDEFCDFYYYGLRGRRPLQTIPKLPDPADLPRGQIVGRAALVDVVTESKDPWFFGPKGLVLFNVAPLAKPIPCKGQLGLFDVDEDLLKVVA